MENFDNVWSCDFDTENNAPDTDVSEKIRREAALNGSAHRNAANCLYALVKHINEKRSCGYSDEKMKQITKNLLYCCYRQLMIERNHPCPIHRNVSETASTMYYLGMTRMEKFNPVVSNLSTFLQTVFHNDCADEYAKNGRSAQSHAESLYAPESESGNEDDDESMSPIDRLGTLDTDAVAENLCNAIRFACNYMLDYASEHLSRDENMILRLRFLEGKSNAELAKELGRDKKSIENAVYRATSYLRREALKDLNALLWKKYGFTDLKDLWHTQDSLSGGYEYYARKKVCPASSAA